MNYEAGRKRSLTTLEVSKNINIYKSFTENTQSGI